MRNIRNSLKLLTLLLAILLPTVPTTATAQIFGGNSGGVVVGNAVTGGNAYAVITEDGSSLVAAGTGLKWSGASAGTGLQIAAGTATTDVNAFAATQTFNNAAVIFTGIKFNATNTASSGSSLLMDLQVAAATKFNVSLSGLATAVGGFSTASNIQGANYINGQSGIFFWTGRATMKSPADGHVQITNNAENANGMLSLGSTALAVTAGALGLPKMTASGTAPGATGSKLELVCGTNAGTAKLVISAGTSATAVTVVDNIGAGVTGC